LSKLSILLCKTYKGCKHQNDRKYFCFHSSCLLFWLAIKFIPVKKTKVYQKK